MFGGMEIYRHTYIHTCSHVDPRMRTPSALAPIVSCVATRSRGGSWRITLVVGLGRPVRLPHWSFCDKATHALAQARMELGGKMLNASNNTVESVSTTSIFETKSWPLRRRAKLVRLCGPQQCIKYTK